MRSAVAVMVPAVLTVGFTSNPSTAQDEPYLELLRSDVKAETVAILTEVMELSDQDGEVFWPTQVNLLIDVQIAVSMPLIEPVREAAE